jgi:hypothetical protein
MNSMGLVEITAGALDGFGADLSLKLIDLERRHDGTYVASARGMHKRQPVAFAASLSPAWEPKQLPGAGTMLYLGMVNLIRLGEEGDSFVRAVDDVYGTGIGCCTMRDRVPYTAVGLATNPLLVESQEVKMKLFFETGGPQRYAELYLNIKPQDGVVQLFEKDQAYRRAVVLSLARETHSGGQPKQTVMKGIAGLIRPQGGSKN